MTTGRQQPIRWWKEVFFPAAIMAGMVSAVWFLFELRRGSSWLAALPSSGLLAFVLVLLVATFRANQRMCEVNWEQWQRIRQDRELVIQPRIRPLDAYTLDLVHELLIPEIRGTPVVQKGPTGQVLALDLGGPISWWTNDMLGYLALQVNWAIRGGDRKVRRIFVWDPNELLSLPGRKMIAIHRLLGFETYIMSRERYRVLMKAREMKALADQQREFLVWDANDAHPSRLAFHGDKDLWGYESPRRFDEPQEAGAATADQGQGIFVRLLHHQDRAENYRRIFEKVRTDPFCREISEVTVNAIEQAIADGVRV